MRRPDTTGSGLPAGQLFAVTLDCSDPSGLADFYRGLLGGTVTSSNATFVVLTIGGGVRLDFQRVDHYTPPTWPDSAVPAQVHLDIAVEDLDDAELATLALGATKADYQPDADRFRVLLDPGGHPFCLATKAAAIAP